jgi:glucose-6-phosphate isomerase
MVRKHNKASLIILVGIGGSDLGTLAVAEAVLGQERPGRKRLLHCDTVDPDRLLQVRAAMEEELRKGRQILINVISKSGGTTETVANFQVLLAALKAKRKDYHKYVVVTTDEDSPFWHLAIEEKFGTLPLPKNVGGRYSVFSPVGLFPLALLGVNIKKLLDGAAHMRAQCLKDDENPAILRAAMLAHEWAHGKIIADSFYFKSDLEGIGKWYRQLMGESIGKEWNKSRTKQLWMGITPTVSVGSTDLHSMAQLYFGGPNDKFFTLVSVKKWSHDLVVPRMLQYDALVPHIQGKKLSVIMRAICEGTQRTLILQNRPFCHIELSDASEESIGALLQLHMMEMMYLAALFDLNAFDQPNVESYKIETKRILARRKV